jgi:hypothetical protein
MPLDSILVLYRLLRNPRECKEETLLVVRLPLRAQWLDPRVPAHRKPRLLSSTDPLRAIEVRHEALTHGRDLAKSVIVPMIRLGLQHCFMVISRGIFRRRHSLGCRGCFLREVPDILLQTKVRQLRIPVGVTKNQKTSHEKTISIQIMK